MNVGIFAKTFPGTSPQAVLEATAAGYDCVQYNMVRSGLGALPRAIEPDIADAVRRASHVTGVKIVAVSATYNMIDPAADRRDAGVAVSPPSPPRREGSARNSLPSAREAVTPRTSGGIIPTTGPRAWSAMCDEFEALIQIAEHHDIHIGIEPEVANVVSSAPCARKLLDSLRSDRLRIVLDAANLLDREGPADRRRIIEEAVDLLADRITLAHAKDRNSDGSFAVVGRGIIDYPHYLATLERAGFTGSLVTHGLDAGDAPSIADFLHGLLHIGRATA